MASPNLTSMNRLIDARDRLLASGLYLGDSSITSNLQWVHNGHAHVLSYVLNTQSHGVHACANLTDNGVTVPSDDPSMSHAGEATANSTDSSNTVPSDDGSPSHGGDTTANRTDTTDTIPSDDSSLCLTGDATVHTTVNSVTLPSDDSLDRPGSPPPEPAVLRAIVRIDSDDFWLTADGGYLGPNTVWKEIADVKPSCTVTDPGLDPITSDYNVVIHVLQDLTQKCVTAGYSSGTSFFSTKDTGAIRFKLRHTLFESLDAADTDGEEDSSTPSDTAVSEAFSFERWPLTKEKNRAELLSLKSTHCILPLPAYDLENHIIRPGSYCRVLQGAIVEVHFTLSHWAIAAVKRDVYGGDIERICLLVPPTHTATTKKRRIPFLLETDVTPPKKSAKV
ncbi:hypothetical protein PISMIDRAFT_688404 [Pisolithus microcarpus 441]|uniref:Uncharacterized protein n=1 Tax=Pisolithus microcarpus 441 TaxID=765257 RepID=A0A0C9YJ06_9AGAM|nr:hypothetical protein PISMIDRAFT_688404 [Pisolithus microcarpus 441]